MKKLLLLLLFIPLVSFGQDNNSTNSTNIKIESNNTFVAIANKLSEGEGIFYKGKGVYTIQQTGKTSMASYKRQVKTALKKIKSYSSGLKLNYEIINTERNHVSLGYGVARATITFKLLNRDGTIAVNELDVDRDRDRAKKELIELKEFLDLGIITQEEFDKKAKPLKKILLGN